MFSEYFLQWYEDFKKSKLSERTRNRYLITQREIEKHFHDKLLEDITRRDYQKFITSYGSRHAKDTVKKVNSLIRSCIRNAIYEDIIVKDFTNDIELVFDSTRTRKIDYLTVAEMRDLSQLMQSGLNSNFTSRQMILTAIYTGMRLGEIQGLRWSNVNTNFKSITIDHSFNENRQSSIPTKNQSSNRIIRINNTLTEMFADMASHKRNDFIFTNQYDRVPTSAAVNKTLHAGLKQLDINRQGFHFHSLRHTHVAYLLYSGVDLYAISKRLGHSDLGTTTRVYSYLIEEYKAKTDNQIEGVLNDIDKKEVPIRVPK